MYMVIGVFSVALYAKDVSRDKAKKVVCIASFFSLFLMFALRHPQMGYDLGYGYSNGYLGSFSKIAGFTWLEAFQRPVLNYEWGYTVFNKLMSIISDDPQFFLAACAFFSLFPVIYVIWQESEYPALATYIFMGLPSFLLLFSGLRQSIAVGICFFAIRFIKRKNKIKFFCTVLLATFFHDDAWVAWLAYPIYYFPMNKARRIVTYVVLPAVYFMRYPLFTIGSKLFKENAIADNNNAIVLFIVFSLVYVFCCLFSNDDEEMSGLKNLFFVACCIQAIGGVYSIAIRVGYYFMNALILLLPLVVYKMKNRQNARIIKVTVSVCFILFGLYSLRTGSWSQSYPYTWFWNG